ncbi:hypothetical protein Tco_1200810 [Tanacetum coccineum]
MIIMENLPPQNDDQNIPEEEPIPGQAPTAPVGFEDPEEEEDDEEDPEVDPEEGDDEEEEMEVDDEEDPEEDSEEGNDEEEEMKVFPPGPRPSDLRAIHSRITKLEKQMFKRRSRLTTKLFLIEEPLIPSASVPRTDDPYVMIRDAAMAAQEDDDDDADAAKDSQPLESRGSPRDP